MSFYFFSLYVISFGFALLPLVSAGGVDEFMMAGSLLLFVERNLIIIVAIGRIDSCRRKLRGACSLKRKKK